MCSGTQFGQFLGSAMAPSFDTEASLGSEPHFRLFIGEPMGVVTGRVRTSVPSVETGCSQVVGGSDASSSLVQGCVSGGGKMGLASVEVLEEEVEFLRPGVVKNNSRQLRRRGQPRKFRTREGALDGSSVSGQQEGKVVLGSSRGSDQELGFAFRVFCTILSGCGAKGRRMMLILLRGCWIVME